LNTLYQKIESEYEKSIEESLSHKQVKKEIIEQFSSKIER